MYNTYLLKNNSKKVNSSKKGIVFDTLTTVNFQKNVKTGGLVIEFYEGKL